MKPWTRRSLVRGLIAILYLALVGKVGWALLGLSAGHRPPGSSDQQVRVLADPSAPPPAPARPSGHPASAVLLPLGPEECGLPGNDNLWREMAEALPLEPSGGKQGFDGLQLADQLFLLEHNAETHLELGHQILDLHRSEGHTYLLNGRGQVLILDIGNPARPEVVGTLSFSARVRSMAVHAGALFLLTRLSIEHTPELVVMDVSVPARPRQLSRRDLPFGAEVMNLFNGFLTVHSGHPGRFDEFVQVYAVAPDHSLSLRAVVDGIEAGNTQLAVGNFWYVAHLRRGGLGIYDMRDPTNPREVARLEIADRITAMARLANRLFAWSSFGNLYVIDIDDPQRPSIRSIETGGSALFQVAFIDGYTYVFSRGGGLHVFDRLPEPRDLAARHHDLADLLLPRSDLPGVLAEGLSMAQDFEIIAAEWWRQRLVLLAEDRLLQLAVHHGHPPSILTELPLPMPARWLTTSRDRIYLGGDERILVVSQAAGGTLHQSADIALPGARTWSAVAIAGSLLAAAGERGLLRFSLADPDRPVGLPGWSLPRQLATLADVRSLASSGNRFFVAAGPAGVLSGRVNGPGPFELVGQLALDGPVRDLVIAEGFCLAATPGAVEVIDVRERAALQRVGRIMFPGVERLALAAPHYWAGQVAGRGWTTLPMPQWLAAGSATGSQMEFTVPKPPVAGIYQVSLFNDHGVTRLPAFLRLPTEESGTFNGGSDARH